MSKPVPFFLTGVKSASSVSVGGKGKRQKGMQTSLPVCRPPPIQYCIFQARSKQASKAREEVYSTGPKRERDEKQMSSRRTQRKIIRPRAPV